MYFPSENDRYFRLSTLFYQLGSEKLISKIKRDKLFDIQEVVELLHDSTRGKAIEVRDDIRGANRLSEKTKSIIATIFYVKYVKWLISTQHLLNI